jgi:hypothetical protein
MSSRPHFENDCECRVKTDLQWPFVHTMAQGPLVASRPPAHRHPLGVSFSSLFAPLDHPRALAQLDQLFRVQASGYVIRAAGDQQVHRARQHIVRAVGSHHLEREIVAHRRFSRSAAGRSGNLASNNLNVIATEAGRVFSSISKENEKDALFC